MNRTSFKKELGYYIQVGRMTTQNVLLEQLAIHTNVSTSIYQITDENYKN